MSVLKQLLVQCRVGGVQAAVLENRVLADYASERQDPEQPGRTQPGAVLGNIYRGKVVNVLPGMQAAFLDIGLAKNAFLYIDDVLGVAQGKNQNKEKPSIRDVLRIGQELTVQVIREASGVKGARVTMHVSLPGRWLVYMPSAGYVGVSRKIDDEKKRERLRLFGERMRLAEEGVILRTAAAEVMDAALSDDLSSLRERWQKIAGLAKQRKAPAELHQEAGLIYRIVRDMLTADTDEIWVDEEAIFEQTVALVREMAPGSERKVKLYPAASKASLFAHHDVDRQTESAFSRIVQLASGGYIVWDETEALTVIDVNTGKFIGTDKLEDTLYRTNSEAAEAIARLLRLRDTGGIIIIDFIDMEEEMNRQRISQQLEELVRRDRSRCTVVGWTRLGLMEITRKKARATAASFYPIRP
ncbi:ribonuclease, Rne/Rng family [Paenibacillus curdlanolyticus YK9]|uniref:Ribonuclease, Rne/Rng family n=1 Tax=Paenibacillus curdlanolyticus YK9 TaxID=717606 RepID=E0IDV8_9BACL|nr:Rne/Rng family ribonuclease [Paenibacillus curdlanolyticus]EFM09312.1 ribonuclease, Rne/Rng family [Paenibacillus curdlanolyticus YK9]